jgi:LPS-assembly protein
MSIARSTTLAMLFLYGAGTPAHAAETTPDKGTTAVDAMRLEIYMGREMRAFGDAEISKDGQYIKGDRIFVNTINDEIHAVGNVFIKQGNATAEGPELRLKMDEREGEMPEPSFTIGDDTERKGRGNASTILFEGPTKERLKSVRYTTCEAGVNDWYMHANELEIDHHSETATATNAWIQFKGVPILYTPWIDFPFSNERSSGILLPTFGSTTRSGFELAVPYYWNIAPEMDATITPRYMSKRGTQVQGEYRYLDRSIPNFVNTDRIEYLPNDDMTGRSRYAINLRNQHYFGDGWRGNLQFERVSDDTYFSDMSTRIALTSRVNLPQQVDLHYDKNNLTNDWHFGIMAQQFQTLDKISYPYQRLPQITLSGFQELGPVDSRLSTEFVRFDKNSAAPATVTGDRYTLYPTASLPLMASYGYITPKVGLRYVGYNLNNAGTTFESKSTAIPTFSLDTGLYFDRTMRVVKNVYTQTLEPRIFYVYIPYVNQNRLPNFDTGLSDLNISTLFSENQFVGGDRINDANQVTLALTSRMIDQRTGVQRLAATVGQRFYFNDPRVTTCSPANPTAAECTSSSSTVHSDFLTVVTAKLLNGWNADAAWQYNTDNSETVRANVGLRYQPQAGQVLNLGYRFTRDRLEQIDVSSEWPLGTNWYGVGRLNYSLRDNAATNDKRGPIETLAGVEYNAGCWQARTVIHRLSTATANANYSIFFQLELTGMSSIGSNPMDLLKRSIPGYSNPDQISDTAE